MRNERKKRTKFMTSFDLYINVIGFLTKFFLCLLFLLFYIQIQPCSIFNCKHWLYCCQNDMVRKSSVYSKKNSKYVKGLKFFLAFRDFLTANNKWRKSRNWKTFFFCKNHKNNNNKLSGRTSSVHWQNTVLWTFHGPSIWLLF